jgi:hypothetical protein
MNNFYITDNVWIRIGPLPLLSTVLGLLILITLNLAWYVNQDATPGWITTVCVLNILLSLLFLGIMLYILQSAGAYMASKYNITKYSPMNIGLSGLNTTRVMVLAIGLFTVFVSSALFAAQKEAQENPTDQTSFFAAIAAGILLSIVGFFLLIGSYNEILQ